MKFDASDRDGSGDDSDEEGTINLQDWPVVKGMYMPDSVNTFEAKADGRRCECEVGLLRVFVLVDGVVFLLFSSCVVVELCFRGCFSGAQVVFRLPLSLPGCFAVLDWLWFLRAH